jgi:hypothetical protein
MVKTYVTLDGAGQPTVVDMATMQASNPARGRPLHLRRPADERTT